MISSGGVGEVRTPQASGIDGGGNGTLDSDRHGKGTDPVALGLSFFGKSAGMSVPRRRSAEEDV